MRASGLRRLQRGRIRLVWGLRLALPSDHSERGPNALRMMEPIVNPEETPGKVVGRRQPPKNGLVLTEAQSAANALAWKRAFGTLRIARGVYRFRTHEEADEWLWQKLTRPPA